MKLIGMEKSPGTYHIVMGLVLLLLATACREINPSPVSFTPTPQTSIKLSLSPAPQNTPTTSPSPTKSTKTPGIPTTEDEYMRITSDRDMYLISSTIRLILTIIGDWVSLQGPCNVWFERKLGENWEKIGHCERTFDDEPYSLLQGEEIKLNLPVSNESQYPYAYTYTLTPGTYRYAITYWTQNENLLIYSPEFQITEFQFTEDGNIRISSLNDTYSITDTIRFDLTVFDKGVWVHGPCDQWFERKEGQSWVKVGYCPDTNFTDEPGSLGRKVKLDLPTSNQDEYHYSYTLTPGTYRYAITYWTQRGDHLIYSPEIQITENQTTQDKFLQVSSLKNTYSLTDTIQFKLTVIGKGVWFQAPCDMWFERKEDQDWKEVGYCHITFEGEPSLVWEGDEIELTLPMSFESQDSFYQLTPGRYRYTITYWEKNNHHLIYSPEFTIVEEE